MKKLLGKLGLFLTCGLIYYIIELLFRGYSHISMFVLSGILGVLFIDTPNNIWSFDMDYRLQVVLSTIFVIIGEGLSGLLLNVKLNMNIWDYSNLYGNFFYGQCNIFFSFAWLIIVALSIFYCDAYNYYICKIEPTPYYKINGKIFLRFKERKD